MIDNLQIDYNIYRLIISTSFVCIISQLFVTKLLIFFSGTITKS